MASVLAFRIWWRLGAGARLPPPTGDWLDTVATLVHKALYALLVTTVLLGVANAWVRGDTLFNLFKIPAFDPGNRALQDSMASWHA